MNVLHLSFDASDLAIIRLNYYLCITSSDEDVLIIRDRSEYST